MQSLPYQVLTPSKAQISLVAIPRAKSIFSRNLHRFGTPTLHSNICRPIHATEIPAAVEKNDLKDAVDRKPLVLIAGAGIGGLVAAIGLLKAGFAVKLFERDTTAIRGEGAYRGPIQIQSNALAALQVIDADVAEEVFENGVITGDRINGLCDGLTGDWYVKFDTFHPAVERGLPVTRVVNRLKLQEILAGAVQRLAGEDVIQGDSHVVNFEDKSENKKIYAVLEDGRRYEGDVLLGADGIWSKTREALWGRQDPSYSEYTCYSGISDFTPPDIDTVGYRVFLGNGKYFVTSDVGGGKMQWYGFNREPAGGTDEDGKKGSKLLEIFGHWCDGVVDLIHATPEQDILRRDIYDRPPIFTWSKGRVVLIGDSAHAMQPNMGQGGCMAIEDGHQLAIDLSKALIDAQGNADVADFAGALQRFSNNRCLRAGAIHGMSGMAAISASTYKAYLGEGLGPLSWIQKFKVPHPGRVGGQFILKYAMPVVLDWILGGNVGALKQSTNFQPCCRIRDIPQHFSMDEFDKFMDDDQALIRASRADWFLMPMSSSSFTKAIIVNEASPVTIGTSDELCNYAITGEGIQRMHARVSKEGEDYFVENLSEDGLTYVNETKLPHLTKLKLSPGDLIGVGESSDSLLLKIKLKHISERSSNENLASEMLTAA